MSQQAFQEVTQNSPESTPTQMRQIEGREWSLWGFTIAVTLALTFGIVSFTFPWFRWNKDAFGTRTPSIASTSETGFVAWQLSYCSSTSTLSTSTCNSTVFDVSLAERDQLFQLTSENAADMIALVDSDGRRLYNSPAYQKVLGYSPEDLKNTSSFEQIHPDDRLRVVKAAEKARQRMMVG